MKHALLVTDMINGYMLSRFYEEAKKRDIILHRYYEPIVDEIDFTLNRRYLEKFIPLQAGVQINRQVDGIFWKDKKRQNMILNTGCEKPTTIIGREFGYQYLVEHLGLPFIAKESFSSGGSGVYMIKNKDDFDKANHCDLFQEVIWNSLGKDVRVFCIGGKPVRCMLRKNNENFKSNFHQGGLGSKYECDNTIRNIVKNIYQCTNLDIMGIDLMLGENGYLFCEINTNPGFEELDRTWNCNTAGEILDFCLSKCI